MGTIPYASDRRHTGQARGTALGVVFLVLSIMPLLWIVLTLATIERVRVASMFHHGRVPLGLLLLEQWLVAGTLAALLATAGIMCIARARAAVHLGAAVLSTVIVGGCSFTVSQLMQRLFDRSPIDEGFDGSDMGEIALRVTLVLVVPVVLLVLLVGRGMREGVLARRGSMPRIPVSIFSLGIVLIYTGLSHVSLATFNLPIDSYFSIFYTDAPLTYWRVGACGIYLLAALMIMRGWSTGWLIAFIAVAAEIVSEVFIAMEGGLGWLSSEQKVSQVALVRGVGCSLSREAWPAAAVRAALPVSVLGMLLVTAKDLLLQDDPVDSAPESTSARPPALPPSVTRPADQERLPG